MTVTSSEGRRQRGEQRQAVDTVRTKMEHGRGSASATSAWAISGVYLLSFDRIRPNFKGPPAVLPHTLFPTAILPGLLLLVALGAIPFLSFHIRRRCTCCRASREPASA